MRRREIALLAHRRERHPVDEVVPVALDMRDAEQRHQRQVLLHADPGPGGQVLGRHEIAARLAVGVEFRHARGVQQRFVQALAVLARHPGIAELQRVWERVQLAVRFIDDQRLFPGQRADGFRQGDRAPDRLFDEQDRFHQALQPRGFGHARPQLADAFYILVLLVAVQRRLVVADLAVQHRRDAREAVEVRRHVAADLELVEAAAIEARDLFQRLGQPVVHALAGLLVRGNDRIDQPHGVAHANPLARPQARQKSRQVESVEIGCQRRHRHARQVGADHLSEGLLLRATQRVENGAVQQRRAIARHQRAQAQFFAAR